MKKAPQHTYVATTNACKLCKPLGACLAFQGIEGCIPFLHGSQGCATYMRRYIISHFREPIDIASSSLGEKHAVYGGGSNLKQGLLNVSEKYQAQVVGLATTCLTETIGDDVPMLLRELYAEVGDPATLPNVIHVSTPSYSGTHMEGFHAVVRAVVDQVTQPGGAARPEAINLLPGLISPADIRYLSQWITEMGLTATILPDISDTLDGAAQATYEKLPSGGTPMAAIQTMGQAIATVELGQTLARSSDTAGELLNERFQVPLHRLGLPIGLRETDRFSAVLEAIAGQPIPPRYAAARGRLVDAYVDGHKYVFGKRAVVYGEEDLVVGITAVLAEIGVQPVLCATGGDSGYFKEAIAAVTDGLLEEPPVVRDDVDFFEITEDGAALSPDLVIGHSKGYPLARQLGIPLIRVGFPIHDRFGGQRILHLGYDGTQALLDQIINAIIAKKQADSPIGYSYL
jgi:nitrogenase molybdenum-iron protein NifN